jgi:imidazolonepropionase-like amidohydrolase
MTTVLLKNAHIVDGTSSERSDQTSIFIENGIVRDVGNGVSSASDNVIDIAGQTLMPGLIDCHVHVTAVVASLGANARLPDSLVAARSIVVMRNMLHRGFTTVRDVGGFRFEAGGERRSFSCASSRDFRQGIKPDGRSL